MSQSLPFISILIPCRNEVNYIGKVIDDILNQDYPSSKVEILVIDGESDDNTQAEVTKKTKLNANIRQLNNPKKIVPTGLNIGIKEAKGEIIVRIDAHCEYPSNYLSYLVDNLINYNADNVGVPIVTHPNNSSLKAKAIALATSSIFGVGNSLFRIGISKAIETDTVPFGCFKASIFEKIGLFDEDLIRNQDDEFNARIIKNGGKIILLPDIKIKYLARGNFTKMAKMFYQYGLFKPLVNKKVGSAATLRQFVPPLFVLGNLLAFFTFIVNIRLGLILFTLIWLPHSLANIYFSYNLAKKSDHKSLSFNLFITFICIHLSYGIGYLRGILRFTVLKKDNRNIDISINR